MQGNFFDEQGNRAELEEILCVSAVRGLTELVVIYVVIGSCLVKGF